MPLLCLASVQQASVTTDPVRVVNITRKEKEYQGMLEYKESDLSRLLKYLIIGEHQFCWGDKFTIFKDL